MGEIRRTDATQRIQLRPTILDKVVGYLSPGHALQRLHARARLDMATRMLGEGLSYEGASRAKRLSSWVASSTSANAETRGQLPILRDRIRDIARNNTYGRRAVNSGVNYMVGAGIRCGWKTLGDSPGAKKNAQKIQQLWNDWCENTMDSDASGQLNFYGLQGLSARTIIESGEALVVRRYDKKARFPLQLQLLEPDYIDSFKDTIFDGDRMTVQGIEIDAGTGRKLAYWLYGQHPGDYGNGWSQSQRVDAADVIHPYMVERVGQLRGVPWLAAAVLRLKDLDDYEDAQLMRQKIAACFSVFVTDANGESAEGWDEEYADRLSPGIIETLPPGKGVEFADPPGAEGYADYVVQVLRAVAVGFGVPYETLTGDYSKVTFSAGRMARNDFWNELDRWQWLMFVPMFLSRVGGWFLETCGILGYDTKGIYPEWAPPQRMLVDPTKEIPAAKEAVRNGFKSRSQVIREMGYDPEEVEREIVEENRRADELGLTFDSDGRQAAAGSGYREKKEKDDDSGWVDD